MKNKVKLLAIALLCLACTSQALTLGRVRGVALIGKPLDVAVPVQMDLGESVSSLCFDAEVFHADTRQDASRVRVLVQAAAQSQTANVRILSSAPVDEPVVTIYLRTGCGQKTSRRYVLLADIPSEVEGPAAAARPLIVTASLPAPVRADLPPAAPVRVTSAKVIRTPASSPRPAAQRRAEASPAKAGIAQVASSSAAALAKSKAGRSSGQSRLKLDPLELFSDRVADLDSFMTFAPTEDALLNQKKVQTLEQDVKALRATASLTEASLRDLKARLQQAQAERFPATLMYALIALVLACLAGVAYLWYRQRHTPSTDDHWWAGTTTGPARSGEEFGFKPEPDQPAASVSQARRQAHEPKRPGTNAANRSFDESGPSSKIDVSMVEMSDSSFNRLVHAQADGPAGQKRSPSSAASALSRLAPSGAAAALLDVENQLKFLVSLGRTEQAVGLLKKFIHEGVQPQPSVYLDLLDLLHSLGLKADFQQMRVEFNRLFNARVPEFASFGNEGKSLESYPVVLSRITALWPKPKIGEAIEAYLFRDPRHPDGEPFDLAAIRDLLMLQAVAEGIGVVPHSDGGASRPDSLPGRERQVDAPSDESSSQPESPGLLDVDLSDAHFDRPEPVAGAALDMDLSLPVAFDHESAHQLDLQPPPENADLLNFDLPETSERPTPGTNKAV